LSLTKTPAPNSTINQTTQQKSPARKQCETAAQEKLTSTINQLTNSLPPEMTKSAKHGAVMGGIGGCIAGAVMTSEAGPGAIAGCLIGIGPGMAIGGLANITDTLGSALIDAGTAALQYSQQMNNVCSKL
jgi:hypothetical protein